MLYLTLAVACEDTFGSSPNTNKLKITKNEDHIELDEGFIDEGGSSHSNGYNVKKRSVWDEVPQASNNTNNTTQQGTRGVNVEIGKYFRHVILFLSKLKNLTDLQK